MPSYTLAPEADAAPTGDAGAADASTDGDPPFVDGGKFLIFATSGTSTGNIAGPNGARPAADLLCESVAGAAQLPAAGPWVAVFWSEQAVSPWPQLSSGTWYQVTTVGSPGRPIFSKDVQGKIVRYPNPILSEQGNAAPPYVWTGGSQYSGGENCNLWTSGTTFRGVFGSTRPSEDWMQAGTSTDCSEGRSLYCAQSGK